MLLNQVRQTNKAIATSVPAPVGGWNTRDALDAMDAKDAVLLDNWFPTTGNCQLRDGYAEHSTGMGSGDVETLFEYHSGSTRKLIACANSNIYDASSSTASSLGSGYTNNQWDIVNFNGNAHLVNGADNPVAYDGSSLSNPSWTGTGLTISNLVGVNVFKNRLFFWENNSQDFWYASINAESGTLTKFPLSRVSQFGGKLLTMETWTLDSGEGADDYAVFIMSSGDVIVYQGTDPGDSTAWSLVGRYHIGEPINSRCAAKMGGDLLIGTVDDYVSLTTVLRTGQVGQSSKISGAVLDASSNSSLFGWQFILDNSSNRFVSNVPKTDGTYDQHVLNTVTGAWTRFVDIPSVTWSTYNKDLYFGSTNGKVYKMTGNTDDGSAINADGRQAWNSFNTPQTKRLAAIRPIISSNSQIEYEIGVGFDFKDALAPSPTSTSSSNSLWDVALWDVALWAGDEIVDVQWRVRGGVGQNLSPRLRVSGEQAVKWLRTDYRMEAGVYL